MSAIVGIYNLDGRPVAPADLGRMVDALAFRGPDGSDIWHDGTVGLGHLMLHTTPESLHETLPLVDKTRDLALTADARIDNRDALSEALELSAEVARGMSDSEFILAAYMKWGEECPKHLLGDFAFVLWDGQQQKLFCARDHFGVKPFYYYHAPGKFFAFATEIKAIFGLDGIPRRLNESQVADHIRASERDVTATFYLDILRLAPAHTAWVQPNIVDSSRYWGLDVNREIHLGSDAEYAAKFRGIFEEAVRCRMRAAFPLGSMLSGGLDSSAIACMTRQLLTEETFRNGAPSEVQGPLLPTFTAVYDVVKQCDEREFSEPVLKQGGYDPSFVVADSLSPMIDWDKIMFHHDEASNTPTAYYVWELYKMAQRKGVRVILDGFDGDSTVSHGIGYLVELASTHRWLKLRSEVRALCQKLGEPGDEAFLQWVMQYGLLPFINKYRVLRGGRRVWLGFRRKAGQKKGPQTVSPSLGAILDADFARRIEETNSRPIPTPPRTEREVHYVKVTEEAIPYILEVVNKCAAAFNLEIRFPLLDVRLAEFCLALPPQQKMRQGWTRLVMRHGTEGILPTEVQWRDAKASMFPGFERGLLHFERVRLDRIFSDGLTRVEGYVNVVTVKEIYSRYVAGVASEEEVMQLWRIASLSLWLQDHSATL